MLNEQDRAKLDGIVQQMTTNKESDANIQFVVDDFKQKYSKKEQPVTPEPGFVQSVAQGVAKPFLGFVSQGRDIATGVKDLATGVKDAVQGKPVNLPQRPTGPTNYDYGYFGNVPSFGQATLDKKGVEAMTSAAGAGAGVASNIVAGGPIKSVGTSILARTLPKFTSLAKQGAVSGAMYGGGTALQDKKSLEEVAIDTGVGALGGAVGAATFGTAIPAATMPIVNTIAKLTRPLQTHMSDVGQNINRALSTQGKKSIGVFLKNPEKQYKAFSIMHDMAPNLTITDEAGDIVPWNPNETNFNQFAQAFKDAKDKTWEGISGAIKHATGQDLQVDAGPILEHLNKTASNKFTTSEVRNAAIKMSDEIMNMTTPGTSNIPIEGLIQYNKVLNTKIGGVLMGTTDNAVRDMEAGLAKQLSEAADKAVESISDGRFATLKDNYGALKTIEKDLVRRAQQESRMLDNSLGDFMSRYGTIEIANGIFQAAAGNAGPLVKGIGAKVLGAYSKNLRTPSTYLQKAFREIDRYKSGKGIQNAAVRGVKALQKNPKGMIDFNAEIFPKKKADKYVRDTPTGKFTDKFKLTEKVPVEAQSRLNVLRNVIKSASKTPKEIWENNRKALNYLNDVGAFVTEKGLVKRDLPNILKAINDVERASKKVKPTEAEQRLLNKFK